MSRSLLLVWLLSGFAHAQDIAGDWLATLRMGPAEVRILLHIQKAPAAGYTATLDGIDQALSGVAVSNLALADSKVSFIVPSLRGSFDGKVNADGSEIGGNWSQGLTLPLTFRRVAASLKLNHKPAKPSDIDGTWEGRLEAENGAPLVFHLLNTEDGLTASIDSPNQGQFGWPVPVVIRTGSVLRMEVKQVGAVFEGKISPDLSRIDGSWGSGAKQWRLVLRRAKETK